MSFSEWFGLAGKRALVTGASRGLGREMALALAEAGADVIITGRTQATLDATAEDIRAHGRHAWTVKADMAVPEECQLTCKRILSELGPIDILINNVGNREVNVSIEAETLETWREMMDLNLTSCFLATKIIGTAMLVRGKGGRIINIASISALIANRGIGGRYYETGKAAVLHFTRCAAADWAPHGVTVNAICPGLFPNEDVFRADPRLLQPRADCKHQRQMGGKPLPPQRVHLDADGLARPRDAPPGLCRVSAAGKDHYGLVQQLRHTLLAGSAVQPAQGSIPRNRNFRFSGDLAGIGQRQFSLRAQRHCSRCCLLQKIPAAGPISFTHQGGPPHRDSITPAFTRPYSAWIYVTPVRLARSKQSCGVAYAAGMQWTWKPVAKVVPGRPAEREAATMKR